jgi:hypothetical protein
MGWGDGSGAGKKILGLGLGATGVKAEGLGAHGLGSCSRPRCPQGKGKDFGIETKGFEFGTYSQTVLKGTRRKVGDELRNRRQTETGYHINKERPYGEALKT